ncbi:protein kinase [Vibrio metschnikovii]|nr:protein kinase [Vibrio metschnikovii]
MIKKNTKILLNGTEFTVLGTLGEGGAGVVFKIEDAHKKLYALKLLKPNAITEKKSRFINELEFCKAIDCNNIVSVFMDGCCTINGINHNFYVMPYFSGTLKCLDFSNFSGEKIENYFFQILNGLNYAHSRGVYHRDLKPENILLDSERDLLVIADWGVASFSEEYNFCNVKTKNGTRLANFKYASPEQKNNDEVEFSSDIYSLGLILGEMFTGKIPVGTSYKSIGSIHSDYAHYDEIVKWMTAQNPHMRPSAKELIASHGCHFFEQYDLDRIFNTVAFELKSTNFELPKFIKPRNNVNGLFEIKEWIDKSYLLSNRNPINVQASSISMFVHRFCRSHPFMDGNKRISYVILNSLLKFYQINLNATANEKIEIINSIIYEKASTDDFGKWIEQRVVENNISAEQLIDALGDF